MINENRYLNSRRTLVKSMGALQLLPDLEVEQFKQELRVSQGTFCYMLKLIEGEQHPQRSTIVELPIF